jgi:hypothetical protein
MLVLGLDLATTTGWALLDMEGERRASGVERLGSEHPRRLLSLWQCIAARAATWPGELVAISYEATNTHRSRAQARVAYALEAVTLLFAERYDLAVVNPTAGQIKALAVAGGASKGAMVDAAWVRWAHLCSTHDEADALWAAEWGRKHLEVKGGSR